MHRDSARKHILIVEDEAVTMIDFSEAFRVAGYDVHLAANLRVAREMVAKHRDSLAAICLDLGLPDGRADSLADEIADEAPELPLALCTAFPRDGIHSRALERGQAVLLHKPIAATEVLRAISGLIAARG